MLKGRTIENEQQYSHLLFGFCETWKEQTLLNYRAHPDVDGKASDIYSEFILLTRCYTNLVRWNTKENSNTDNKVL